MTARWRVVTRATAPLHTAAAIAVCLCLVAGVAACSSTVSSPPQASAPAVDNGGAASPPSGGTVATGQAAGSSNPGGGTASGFQALPVAGTARAGTALAAVASDALAVTSAPVVATADEHAAATPDAPAPAPDMTPAPAPTPALPGVPGAPALPGVPAPGSPGDTVLLACGLVLTPFALPGLVLGLAGGALPVPVDVAGTLSIVVGPVSDACIALYQQVSAA